MENKLLIILDWWYQYLQMILLVIVFFLPIIFNASSIINGIFLNNSINFENYRYYILMKLGNVGIGGILSLLTSIYLFKKINNGKVLNKGKCYHCHFYIGYFVCSKILWYNKCKLKKVPIYMQFKLIINDTFELYDYGDELEYKILLKENLEVLCPKQPITSVVNLILSDTYPISIEMLPQSYDLHSTYWINRDIKNNSIRVFSESFYEKVRNIVQKMPNHVTRIDLYSTLNPRHCEWIAKSVFDLGGRSTIKALYIHPQKFKNDIWIFENKGKKIFDYSDKRNTKE